MNQGKVNYLKQKFLDKSRVTRSNLKLTGYLRMTFNSVLLYPDLPCAKTAGKYDQVCPKGRVLHTGLLYKGMETSGPPEGAFGR